MNKDPSIYRVGEEREDEKTCESPTVQNDDKINGLLFLIGSINKLIKLTLCCALISVTCQRNIEKMVSQVFGQTVILHQCNTLEKSNH